MHRSPLVCDCTGTKIQSQKVCLYYSRNIYLLNFNGPNVDIQLFHSRSLIHGLPPKYLKPSIAWTGKVINLTDFFLHENILNPKVFWNCVIGSKLMDYQYSRSWVSFSLTAKIDQNKVQRSLYTMLWLATCDFFDFLDLPKKYLAC